MGREGEVDSQSPCWGRGGGGMVSSKNSESARVCNSTCT